MPIALGQLDRQLVFQRRDPVVRNAFNEEVPAGWATIATVMGKRTAVKDLERNTGVQVQREVSDRFVTHYSAALLVAEQVICEGVTYDLVGRKEIDRRVGIEWSALARPDNGSAA